MTPLPIGPLRSQEVVMKPCYQGGLSEVAFLGGCQSVTCSHGLWSQFHVGMAVRQSRVPSISQSGETEAWSWPGLPQAQRSPGYGEYSIC